MKEIFPSNQTKKYLDPTEKPITEQQYQDLVNRTNVAVCCAEVASDKVDTLNENLARQVATANVNTTSLTADNATIGELNSTKVNSNSVCSNATNTGSLTAGSSCVTGNENINGHLTVGGRADVNGELTSNVGVVAPFVSVTNSLNAKNASIQCNLTVNGRFLAYDFQAPNPTFTGNATADSLNANAITSDNATIENLESTEASIDNAEIDEALVTELDTNYITHKNDPQEIDGGTIVDHYILLPDFTNGNYFLEARNDGGTKLWSVEFTNSIDNVQMRWSQTEDSIFQLIDLKATKTAGGVAKVQLHVKAFEHLTLYRQSQSTDNVLPPTIYTEDQLPEAELNFDITEYKGTFIQDIIFTNKLHVNELEMDSLVMDCVGITKELLLTCDRDINLNPIFVNGCENQYVQNKIICGIQSPTWVTPATCVSCTCEDLISSKGVAAYNGETVEEEYPIVHLGDTTCVHGSAEIGTDLKVNDDFRTPHIADTVSTPATLVNDSLVFKASSTTRLNKTVFNAGVRWYDDELNQVEEPDASWTMTSSTHIGDIKALHDVPYVRVDNNWYEVTGFGLTIIYSDTPVTDEETITELEDLSRPWILVYRKEYYKDVASNPQITRYRDGCFDEIAVKNSECVFDDNHPLVYNSTRDAIETTTCLEVECGVFDNAKVNCRLDVDGDTHIAGDLFVAGTTHTVEEETLSTGSDTIILRQNNPTGMATGEFTGIISNKYNGTDNLAFGSGNDGQFRLGHVSGTTETRAVIYYKDGIWYRSIDPVTTTTVNGELTSYSSKSIEGDYTKYTDAVFTVFNYSNLQPALTREEETDIVNDALLKFNRNTHRAEDIAIPTCAEQVLSVASVTPTVPEVCSYVFASNNGLVYDCDGNSGTPVGTVEAETTFATTGGNTYFRMLTASDGGFKAGTVFRGVNNSHCSDFGWYYYDVYDKCLHGTWRLYCNQYLDITWPASNASVNKINCRFYHQERSEGGIQYQWIDKQPGIYCFTTMADYNAYTGNIPVGSQIVIAECNGYIQAEEM